MPFKHVDFPWVLAILAIIAGMVVVFQNQRTDIAPTDEWYAYTSAVFTIEFTNHRVFCHV